MRIRKIAETALLAVLITISVPATLGAQATTLSQIYAAVDTALAAKSSESLFLILSEHKNDVQYANVEAYVLMQARQLIIRNDLDFAQEITLAVIDNNLDNFEAVDLYTSVNKAIAKRNAEMQAAEEKKQLEDLKAQVASIRAKEAIQKEYKTVTNTASGETVYLDQDLGSHYLPFSWNVLMGMANVGVMFNPALEVQYGMRLDANFFYHGDKIAAGAEISTDILFMTFYPEEGKALPISFRLAPAVAWNPFSRNLFLRVGFFGFLQNNQTDGNRLNSFMTPLAGIGFREYRFGVFSFDGYADYYAAHLWNLDTVKFAGEAGANFTVMLADLDEMDINLRLGVNSALYVLADSFNIHNKLTVSIGVGNND